MNRGQQTVTIRSGPWSVRTGAMNNESGTSLVIIQHEDDVPFALTLDIARDLAANLIGGMALCGDEMSQVLCKCFESKDDDES